MDHLSPAYLRHARRIYVVACGLAALAAIVFGAFTLGLTQTLTAEADQPRSAHGAKARALGDITAALANTNSTAALSAANSAAERYAALARTPAETAGAQDIMGALAAKAGGDASAEGRALATVAGLHQSLMMDRYRTLHGWTVWSARAGVAALVAVGLIGLAGVGLTIAALRRTKQMHKEDAYRFHDAVGRIERAQNKLARAAEGLRRQAFTARNAGADISQTTLTLTQVGKAFGEGATNLLAKLETHAGALKKTANETDAEVQSVLGTFQQAQSDFETEIQRTKAANDELTQTAAALAPGLKATSESLTEAASAFGATARSTIHQLDETILSLRGGQDDMADALALVKTDFVASAKDITEAVRDIHTAAAAFDAAGRLFNKDAETHGETLKTSAAALLDGRTALHEAVMRLADDDGALTRLENRLSTAENHLVELQAPGDAALKPVLADLRSLAENAARGVASIVMRLEQSAIDLEAAAGKFALDDAGAAMPSLDEAADIGMTARAANA